MDSRIKIAPFEAADADGVVDLVLSIQQLEFNIPISLADQPDLQDVAGFFQHGISNFWVAKVDARVVGSIAILDIGAQQGVLRKMFVKAGFRGAEYGIARRLLETLVQHCHANGVREIYLGTADKLHAACRFYEKNEFSQLPKATLPPNFPIMAVDNVFYVRKLA